MSPPSIRSPGACSQRRRLERRQISISSRSRSQESLWWRMQSFISLRDLLLLVDFRQRHVDLDFVLPVHDELNVGATHAHLLAALQHLTTLTLVAHSHACLECLDVLLSPCLLSVCLQGSSRGLARFSLYPTTPIPICLLGYHPVVPGSPVRLSEQMRWTAPKEPLQGLEGCSMRAMS